MGQEFIRHEQINYAKEEDLHAFFTLIKGDFKKLKKEAPTAKEAIAYLDNIREDFHTTYIQAALKQGAYEEYFDFFFARTPQDFFKGLISILRDAGYKAEDIRESVRTMNLEQEVSYISPNDLAELTSKLLEKHTS